MMVQFCCLPTVSTMSALGFSNAPPLPSIFNRSLFWASSKCFISNGKVLARRRRHFFSSRLRNSCRMCSEKGKSSGGATEWEALIMEFEERSIASKSTRFSFRGEQGKATNFGQVSRPRPPPPGKELGRLNPKIYEEVLPLAESAMMAALTSVMWSLGQFLRLESVFALFYPLPTLYIAMRWGAFYGNTATVATIVLPLICMGPLHALLYLLGTGLLTFAFVNAMWRQLNWFIVLLLGILVKMLGLIINITWTSALLRANSWEIIVIQVASILDKLGTFVFKALGRGSFPSPSMRQVKFGVGAVIGIHTTIHVISVYLVATMILDRLFDGGHLKRGPKLIPFLGWLKTKVRGRYDHAVNGPLYKTVDRDTDSVQNLDTTSKSK